MTARDGDADVAPDGSPVEFYRRLPETGEAAFIHGLIAPGASVLDLGCGPGRIAGPLTAFGHPVTGVDDGAAMIAALPPGVDGVVGDATTIRLGRRFGAVLLVSHLINAPDVGPAFARTAAAHLGPRGVVIGETYPPGWDPTAGVGQRTNLGDAFIETVSAVVAAGLLTSEVRYGVDGREWRQRFQASLLDEAGVRAVLMAGGLAFDRWLERPGWFLATAPSGS